MLCVPRVNPAEVLYVDVNKPFSPLTVNGSGRQTVYETGELRIYDECHAYT